MAFTASLDLVEKQDDGKVRLLITYTDGVSKSQQNLYVDSTFDQTALKNAVINRLSQLTSLDSLKKTLPLGSIDTTPAVPVQSDIDRQAYFALAGKLQQLKQQVDLGIIDIGSKTYADLLGQVQAAFKPSYFGL